MADIISEVSQDADQAKRDETYRQSLKKELSTKKGYLKAVDLALTRMPNIEGTDELTLKKRAIAMYETLNRQPYNPERGEVLGIAIAQSNMAAQVDALNEYKKHLLKKKQELVQKRSFQRGASEELANLNLALEERTASESEKRRRYVTDRNPQETKLILAKEKLANLEEREEEMVSNLRYVLDNYFIQPKIDLLYASQSEHEMKRVRQRALKLVERLVNEVFDGTNAYIAVENSDPFVRHLIKADIVEHKNHMSMVRLRRFDVL